MRLFHVSDRDGIACFEPRPPPSLDAGVSDEVVWAIEARLLANYLLPRDCPRVTFHATATTTPADVARFFAAGQPRHVVAIEEAWAERVCAAELRLYEFPPEKFTLADANAAYWVSREPVVPTLETGVADLPAAIGANGAEFRTVPSLWPLRDAVFASTLGFSFIRMRHAQPRSDPARG
jgi:hypothetical protein